MDELEAAFADWSGDIRPETLEELRAYYNSELNALYDVPTLVRVLKKFVRAWVNRVGKQRARALSAQDARFTLTAVLYDKTGLAPSSVGAALDLIRHLVDEGLLLPHP
jgi:hypothetical protein